MSFQHNGFQQNAFQVQVVGAVGGEIPMRTLMGVGLGVRLLAASRLKENLSRRQLFKTFVGLCFPVKGK
jgi:hypothetical protein